VIFKCETPRAFARFAQWLIRPWVWAVGIECCKWYHVSYEWNNCMRRQLSQHHFRVFQSISLNSHLLLRPAVRDHERRLYIRTSEDTWTRVTSLSLVRVCSTNKQVVFRNEHKRTANKLRSPRVLPEPLNLLAVINLGLYSAS